MFLRTINHCADWLATVCDEPDDSQQRRAGRQLLFVALSLGLAAGVVTVTTLVALGLDALLHAQAPFTLVR